MERNIRVCIIDDDEKIGKMFQIIFRELGVSADYVLNGHDAIEQVKSNDYAALFMDIIMPGMNGVQVLEKIRSFNTRIPVVMISGYLVTELLEKAKEFGIYSSLNKPIYISQIVDVMRSIIDGKKQEISGKKRCLIIDEQQSHRYSSIYAKK